MRVSATTAHTTYRLVDREAAAAAGILVERTRLEAPSNSELEAYAAQHGYSVPGFDRQDVPPVSYSAPGEPAYPQAPEW